MHPAIWIGAGLVALVTVLLVMASRRGERGPDLGSVSSQWIAQHRPN
jgi:hypothetical protein